LATRTDFKDVKWTEQTQDVLKFVNSMKRDVQVSVYKRRKFLNHQCAQTLQEDTGPQRQLMLPATCLRVTASVRPMFENETESEFRKQLKEFWKAYRQKKTSSCGLT
jgi:hypothetical protein